MIVIFDKYGTALGQSLLVYHLIGWMWIYRKAHCPTKFAFNDFSDLFFFLRWEAPQVGFGIHDPKAHQLDMEC